MSRCLSNAEVSTALRPFFFLVHPDLFGKHVFSSRIGLHNQCTGKYPNEQSENEVNLKTLKNYVDMMAEGKKRPNPSDVRFFVRPKVVYAAIFFGTIHNISSRLAQAGQGILPR